MAATTIDGTLLAGELHDRLAEEVRDLRASGVQPGLATVLVGEDYPSQAYERRVRRLADELDCRYVSEQLPADVELADALGTIGRLNADPRITGILVLRPLPPQVPEVDLYRLLDPAKDIEAVTPVNAGLLAQGRPRFIPSTPAACFHMLDEYMRSTGRDPATAYDGVNLVLVGRSNNVGKPAVWLGLQRNATVISAHHYTDQAGRLPDFTRLADIVVVAVGVPGIVTGDMVREGVIAIDVGINPVRDEATGKVHLVGDLDFDSVARRAEAVSPVPGGVGPITDIWLLHNTVRAAAMGAHVVRPRHFGMAP
ncbi:MAG TPA: tetrahydrofolate dehydrogenase/cyclohydrolase catalytic domain-containing protein [Actinomycetota bacterium]|nr:tetrahydrofolate dehydrogenase/cyclohydrolase catalytic domain-containing protein [Actinomycetota bacterium]